MVSGFHNTLRVRPFLSDWELPEISTLRGSYFASLALTYPFLTKNGYVQVRLLKHAYLCKKLSLKCLSCNKHTLPVANVDSTWNVTRVIFFSFFVRSRQPTMMSTKSCDEDDFFIPFLFFTCQLPLLALIFSEAKLTHFLSSAELQKKKPSNPPMRPSLCRPVSLAEAVSF